MLFAPLAMTSGAAMAMAPGDHHAQMMKDGHCGEQSPERKDSDKADKICCVAMCVSAAVVPAFGLQPPLLVHIEPVVARQDFLIGAPGKLPTPPPRGA